MERRNNSFSGSKKHDASKADVTNGFLVDAHHRNKNNTLK